MQVIDIAAPLVVQRWRPCAAAAVAVGLFSSLLIVGSYTRLSHTWDEPTHVASGMEWLQFHRYTLQTENPPLSRVPLAIVPYLSGTRLDENGAPGIGAATGALFYDSGDYATNVAKARVANLLFFWLMLTLVWVLSG